MVTVPLLDTSIAAPVMEMVFEPPPVGLTIGLGPMVTEPPLSSLTGSSTLGKNDPPVLAKNDPHSEQSL